MKSKHRFDPKKFRVSEGDSVRLKKISCKAGDELTDKNLAAEAIAADASYLQEVQQVLFASGSHSLLIILQGMDASGKDGIVRHVMGGVNPQGCRVHSFKAPSSDDLQHHFLWRPMRFLPERGMISIFNRSYYEEVLVVRVHPEFLKPQRIPKMKKLEDLWEQRFEEIRQFEKALVQSGTLVLKFFLHISREEQAKQMLERLNDPAKHWKFNERDLEERKLWEQYDEAYEAMFPATSTKKSPWYIIPSDDRWYARAAVADIVAGHLEELELSYPAVTEEQKSIFAKLSTELQKEVGGKKKKS